MNEFATLRRELGLLYLRFYSLLMVGFLFMYFVGGLFQIFVMLMYSFWVPQIYCNAVRDSNKALLPQYVIGISITRILIPLYFYGCPKNFIHAEPNYRLSMLLLLWMFAQVAFLFLQDKYGARFFIPKKFLPPKYDYSRQILLPPGETKECVICMSTIDLSLQDYMITPCDHVFHGHCLLQWLNQKMECPTCRGALPNV